LEFDERLVSVMAKAEQDMLAGIVAKPSRHTRSLALEKGSKA
jgi:hypothetical protein